MSKIYKPFDRFIVRSPVFSLDFLNDFYNNKFSLNDIIHDKIFQEAIYYASKDLYIEMIKLIENPNYIPKKKFYDSILKYLIRGGMRCTPFGLFAGCSVGRIDKTNEIERNNTDPFKKAVRLDMEYLNGLIEMTCELEEIKRKSKFILNTSIYRLGDKFRYINYTYKKGRKYHHLSNVIIDEYLLMILDLTKKGSYFNELIQCLTSMGIDYSEAESYISALIEKQIIVNDLEPSVSGDDILDRFSTKLSKILSKSKINSDTGVLKSRIQEINNHKIGHSLDHLEYLFKFSNNIYEKASFTQSIFQADLHINNFKNTISNQTVESVLEAITVISKLSLEPRNDSLISYAQQFYEKYEDEEIPILEALDVETGIPFGRGKEPETEELLKGLNIKNINNSYRNISIKMNPTEEYLMDKYFDCIKNNERVIEIKDSEIEKFSDKAEHLPSTFSCIIEILNRNQEGLPDINIKGIKGGAGASLIGRFCHLNEQIKDLVIDISKKEEELTSDCINAEILHLPDARSVNVIFRPSFRKFEIPFLSNISNNGETVIPLSDIYVSVKNSKDIILRSKKLNKIIFPRLTNAHNYFHHSSLSLYSFLCALQNQHSYSGLYFQWNDYLKNKHFLPRVIYKNVIISLASWKIMPNQMDLLPINTDKHFFNEAKLFLKELGVPQYVYLGDSDNKLLINTNHKASLELLFLNRKRSITLTEFLFSQKDGLMKCDSENFTNEVILGFYKVKNQNERK